MSTVAMVNLGKSALGVTESCRLLGVSKSSYYDQMSRTPERARRCRALVSRIRAVFEEHLGNYGSPRIHRTLQSQGIRVSCKRVASLMHEYQLVARRKRGFKPQKTDSNHKGPFAPNLLEQDFSAEAQDQKWVGDITFVDTSEGWSYLAVIVDVFSRRVVGWATSDSPDANLVVAALKNAKTMRRPPSGLIVHTDRGCQYASKAYLAELKEMGAIASMSRTGNCYDNAMAESFFSTLDFELRRHWDFSSHREATKVLANYIDNYYNRKRIHSSIDYMTPVAYEQAEAIN